LDAPAGQVPVSEDVCAIWGGVKYFHSFVFCEILDSLGLEQVDQLARSAGNFAMD
jgi:hypothetical protein